MSKSKRARSRCAPKPWSNPGTRKSAAPHHGARTNSKQAGAAAAAPAEWGHGRHLIGIYPRRGFFAGVVRKKLGPKLASEPSDRGRVYRIGGGQARSDRARHHRCRAERLIMQRRCRAGRDRGRDRSYPFASARRAAAAVETSRPRDSTLGLAQAGRALRSKRQNCPPAHV